MKDYVPETMLGLKLKNDEVLRDQVNQVDFGPEINIDQDSLRFYLNRNTINTTLDVANPPYKYAEDRIISDFKDYIDSTYGEHYTTDGEKIQCFDAWIAMGDATPTFRNTAIKYLWRYGKKSGNNKKDLMKALHYVLLCLYNDHYKE